MKPLPENFVWSAMVPELLVTDLRASLEFWRGILGFSVAYDRPEANFCYLEHGKVQIMLLQIDEGAVSWHTGALEQPLGRGVNFQIEVDMIEPALGKLASAGWPLFRDAEEKWYRAGNMERGQRQFWVQDPDGYLVRLIEPLGMRQLNKIRSSA